MRGGDRRPHAPRRLCGARRGGAREHAGSGCCLPPAACRAGTKQGRRRGRAGPSASWERTSDLERSDWSSRRTTSLYRRQQGIGQGVAGPRPFAPRAPALEPFDPPPTLSRARPLRKGSRKKLPEAGGGGSLGKVSLCLKRKGRGRGVPPGSWTRAQSPPRISAATLPYVRGRGPGRGGEKPHSRPHCGSAKESGEEPARQAARGDSWC